MGKRGHVKTFGDWITTQEVAKELGWSVRKVQRHAKEGVIPVQRRVGKRGVFIFLRKDILIFKRSLYRPFA